MKNIFNPKFFTTFRDYSWSKFVQDSMAGLIVGVVALPLAIAFAIASGVSPEKGLITAIIGGFLVSVFGGSRVQIGGPTGAFIIIVYGVVQKFGVEGLIIATFMAGIILILMGLARLGSVIKFIPNSLIIGFTSGIAVIIFSSQIKDFFGLEMGEVPADFVDKWKMYFSYLGTINVNSVIIALATIGIILVFPKVSKKIPGSLVAIVLTTLAVMFFDLPVETIGSRFGTISSAIPAPSLPKVSYEVIREMIQPAIAIAMLGAIESLLSAVVADGMIRGNHRSNTELIGQGIANVGSSFFGGIPATGAIARTATNVNNGGRTPVAGIIHAIVLLTILVFLGKWASLIPLSALAGVLVIIAFNMSEYRNFITILKGPKGDIAVMLVTFLLTVLVDLTIAIQIGIILAAFSFIRKMVKTSDVKIFGGEAEEKVVKDELLEEKFVLPKNVSLFEISGPMFFGASFRIREAIRYMEKPKVLIVLMRNVPIIDASGLSSFKELLKDLDHGNTKVIIAELQSYQVKKELFRAGIFKSIGRENIQPTLEKGVERAEEIIAEKRFLE
ncbi:MAG TPA: SulP family inorganic anion transporter [Flavobacteriaceae bacterium]|nr:SulP family inorganic anion transporter [Flavobacteriaceae bacterium]